MTWNSFQEAVQRTALVLFFFLDKKYINLSLVEGQSQLGQAPGCVCAGPLRLPGNREIAKKSS